MYVVSWRQAFVRDPVSYCLFSCDCCHKCHKLNWNENLAAMFEVTHDGRHVRHGVKMHRQKTLRFQVLYGSDLK